MKKGETFREQDGLVLRPAELTEVVDFKRQQVEALAAEYWRLWEAKNRQYSQNEYYVVLDDQVPNSATGFNVEMLEIGNFSSNRRLDKIKGLGLTLRIRLTREYRHTDIRSQQISRKIAGWELRLTRLLFIPRGVGSSSGLKLVALDTDAGGNPGARNWQRLDIFEQAVLLTTTADLLTSLIAACQET